MLVGGDNGTVYAYVPNAKGLPLPPMDRTDLPTPVKSLEPERPLPAARAAAAPTSPAVAAPTVTTPQPPAAPTEAATPPAPPVAKPVTFASAPPPTELARPVTPAPATPPTAPKIATPPADFPSAVTPLSGPVTAPATPAVTPITPVVKPPVQPAPTTALATGSTAKPSVNGPRLPLLTLLMAPADGRTPILLTNQSYLHVGGKIAPGSDTISIRVNGLEAAVKDGAYQTQVTFPGPGDYQLLIEATSAGGETSTYRRSVTVVSGIDASSPNRLVLRPRNASPVVLLSAGTRGQELARFRKTIEIRNEQGQLVNNWTMAADGNTDIAWNGANANGTALPLGSYEISYILSGENGPIAWLRQPVELKE
jgi:hypothetical protein